MSGDPRIVLVGDEEGFLARAVDTLGRLPVELPAWAIVGGLGVYLRIGDVHRETEPLPWRSSLTPTPSGEDEA